MSEKEEIKIRRFKDNSLNFWANYLHYSILDGKLICAAGGIETEETRNRMVAYLKRNKIKFEL